MNSLIQLRRISVRAKDTHVIREHDSIDEAIVTHRGMVMAPNLACNVAGAVGQLARAFNSIGRQVWTPRMLPVSNHKIVRQGVVL